MLEMISSIRVLSWTVLLFLIAFLTSRYRRQKSIPGPLLASLTDLWQAYYQNSDNFSSILTQLHKKYGPIVRVGPNRVSFSDAAVVPTIYTMHGEFRKANSYHPLRAPLSGGIQGSILDIQDEQVVSSVKRAIGGLFSAKNVQKYETDIDAMAKTLIDRIISVRTIDLFQTLQQFQVDFLMKVAFSHEPSYLLEGKDAFSISFHRRFSHWMQWQAIPFIEHLIFKPPFLRKFINTPTPLWARMAQEALDNRQNLALEKREKNDLLEEYLNAAEKHKDTITLSEIQRLISSTISAGSDTTAFTMTAMLYLLLKNPHTLIALQSEFEAANLSTASLPSFSETTSLPYLNAVIKEAMRIYPFLNLILERVVPQSGAEIAGHWLPGGTVVGCNPTVVHRDTKVFGADADAFRPERWLTYDAGARIAMERGSLRFGAGKRACIGRHVAELEIKKVIPALLLRFRMTFTNASTEWETMDNLTSFPKPIFVMFEERT